MTWLKSNWRGATLNLIASSVLIFVVTQGSADWNSHTFDIELESGKWAIRLLLTCLTMTPLQTYLGWSSALKLRKPAGLWAFAFAIVHVTFLIRDARLSWLEFPMQLFIALGLTGFTVLTALAITSNRWAMRRLGKNWKRLHRLVYLAGAAVASHAILATAASKKIILRDPQSSQELKIYLAVLVVLLVVRLPFVRQLWRQVAVLRQSIPHAELAVVPVAVPDSTPEYPPNIYASDEAITMDEYVREFSPVPDIENETADAPRPSPMDLPLAR